MSIYGGAIFFVMIFTGARLYSKGSVVIITIVLSMIIFVVFIYFVSCLIIFGWSKFFELSGKKAGLYKKIVMGILLVLFLVFAVLLPAVGEVSIEKRFVQTELSRVIAFSSPDEDIRIQELTIKNNLILPVKYLLPPKSSLCVYDLEGKVVPAKYDTAYKDENNNFVGHDYQDSQQNVFFVITLKAREEKKIYVTRSVNLELDVSSDYLNDFDDDSDITTLYVDLGYYDKYNILFKEYKMEIDEFLFFENKGLDMDCSEVTMEDRDRVEKIKLI